MPHVYLTASVLVVVGVAELLYSLAHARVIDAASPSINTIVRDVVLSRERWAIPAASFGGAAVLVADGAALLPLRALASVFAVGGAGASLLMAVVLVWLSTRTALQIQETHARATLGAGIEPWTAAARARRLDALLSEGRELLTRLDRAPAPPPEG